MKSADLRRMRRSRLVGIGCGPRNTAIAVTTHVNGMFGAVDLDYRIVEPTRAGASWSGQAGYTDGTFPLDTSPLKDLTFPGNTGLGEDADRALARFSFIDFLRAEGRFAQWVSRGSPPISHAQFAEYQAWAIAKSEVPVHRGLVRKIEIEGPELVVIGETPGVPPARAARFSMIADGVVMSGPGDPRRAAVQDDDPLRIFDGRSYWTNRNRVRELSGGRAAVIGSGQSAGTIAKSMLLENPGLRVDMINRYGFLPVQSSGFHENFMCSNAGEDWTAMPQESRRAIMSRINNGVMEASIKTSLDSHPNLQVVRGSVDGVTSNGIHGEVLMANGERREYDCVVIAMGFDPAATLRRMLPKEIVNTAWFANFQAEPEVDYHLRVPGLACNLHVPALAGLSQGPGLALLSCLSTMARRVVSAYLPVAPEAGEEEVLYAHV